MKCLIKILVLFAGIFQIVSAQSDSKHVLYAKAYTEILENMHNTRYTKTELAQKEYYGIGKMWLEDLRKYCKTDIFDKATSWKCARPTYTLFSLYFTSEEDLKQAIKALQTLPMGSKKDETVVIPKNEKISNSSIRIQHNQHELLIISSFGGGSSNNKDAILKQFQNVQGTGVVDLNREY